MARLVACEGHKGLPHETITYLFNADHPYRCPLCDTLDQLGQCNPRAQFGGRQT